MALPAPARILSPACLSDALIFQKALNDKLLPQSPMMSRLETGAGTALSAFGEPVRPLRHLSVRDPGRAGKAYGTRAATAGNHPQRRRATEPAAPF
jgi:hypothetical protein